MILVVGATGILGSEICRRLVARGEHVRGMVRATSNPELVAQLEGLGVELVQGDLKQPETLAAAVKGAKVVVSPATSTRSRQDGDSIDTVDRDGQLALVDAAEAEGVDQFVFVSFPPMPDEFPLQSAKRAVEGRLKKGLMPFTVLQPVNFMEVWLSPFVGFDVAAGKIRLYGNGDQANFWIANGDVAEFVVQAVGNERALGKLLPAGGPDAMSQREVAAVFEELTGRTFEYEHLPVEVMKGMLQDDDEMTRTAAGLMLNCAAGDYVDLTETLEILPVQRTGIREFAEGLLAQMKG